MTRPSPPLHSSRGPLGRTGRDPYTLNRIGILNGHSRLMVDLSRDPFLPQGGHLRLSHLDLVNYVRSCARAMEL
jgi:hypothetical protein